MFHKYKIFSESSEPHQELKGKFVCNVGCTHFPINGGSFAAVFSHFYSQNWLSITDRHTSHGLCSFLYPNIDLMSEHFFFAASMFIGNQVTDC